MAVLRGLEVGDDQHVAGLRIVGDELDRLHPLGGSAGEAAAALGELVELAPELRRDATEEPDDDLPALVRRQTDLPAVAHPQIDPAADQLAVPEGACLLVLRPGLGAGLGRSHEREASMDGRVCASQNFRLLLRYICQPASEEEGQMSSKQTVIRVGPGDTTLRGRLLGARLREKREATGLKLVEASKQMKRRPSSLSRWETGDRIPRPADLFYALEVYGVRGAERDAIMRLAEEAHERPESPDVVSMAVADYGWLQRRAYRLECFWDTVLPGLLQTPDYARAVLKIWDPAASKEWLERTVAVRIARQERLAGEDALELCAVLGEGALRAVVGGPEIMRAQLRHLLDCAALPTVELRIVPFVAGEHAGFTGPFSILRFHDDRDLTHVTTRGGDIYFEDAEPFAQALRRIKRVALPQRESVAKIAAVAKEMA